MIRECGLVDGHIHLNGWFDKNGRDFFEGLDALQKERSIKAMNLAALPNGTRGDAGSNIMAALYKLHNPACYAHAGLVFPQMPVRPPLPQGLDALSQYRELMEIGFDGIKIICTKPQDYLLYDLPVTHEYYEPFFEAAEKDGTHILWHVADPATFWDRARIPERFLARGWYYGEGGYPSNVQIYREVFAVLKRHPALNITFSHFFFLSDSPEVLERIFAAYPGVTVDLTPGTEMYESFYAKSNFFREFFKKYNDRILFGTDTAYPGYEAKNLHDSVYRALTTHDTMIPINAGTFSGIGIDAESAEKIFARNFETRVSASPKRVDRAALRRYIAKYTPYLRNEIHKKEILEWEKRL